MPKLPERPTENETRLRTAVVHILKAARFNVNEKTPIDDLIRIANGLVYIEPHQGIPNRDPANPESDIPF